MAIPRRKLVDRNVQQRAALPRLVEPVGTADFVGRHGDPLCSGLTRRVAVLTLRDGLRDAAVSRAVGWRPAGGMWRW